MRTIKRLLLASLLTLLAIVACIAGFLWWQISAARERLAQEEKRIRDRGEAVTFAELIETRKSESRDADLLSAAASRLSWPAEYEKELGPSTIDELFAGDLELSPAQHAAVQQALTHNEATLREMLEIARRHEVFVAYDGATTSPSAIVLPHVSPLRNAQRLVCYRAIDELDDGNSAAAMQSIQDCFDLSETLRHEPFLVCQLVRLALLENALDLLERVLAESPPAGSLVDAEAPLADIERHLRLEDAVLGERASLYTTFESVGTPEFGEFLRITANFTPSGPEPLVAAPTFRNWWWGSVFYAAARTDEQVTALRLLSRFAELVGQAGPAPVDELESWREEVDREIAERPICGMVMPAVDKAVWPMFKRRQRLRNAQLALRVLHHRAATGTLPVSLAEVVDEGDVELIEGLLSGQQVQYEVAPESFLIVDSIERDGETHEARFTVKLAPAAQSADSPANEEAPSEPPAE